MLSRTLVLRIVRALAGVMLAATSSVAAQDDTRAAALVSAAHSQIGVTVRYDGRYERLTYPNGDVPLNRGVCTDVVIRAYRTLGIDLQRRVHEDMRAHFAAYPKLWGLRSTDRSIDHRRVPNLAVFFARNGKSLGTSDVAAEYRPGDIVTWTLPGNLPHIGLVSDRRAADGVVSGLPLASRPLIVHNVGAGAQVEDVLFAWPITGHYRYLPQEPRP